MAIELPINNVAAQASETAVMFTRRGAPSSPNLQDCRGAPSVYIARSKGEASSCAFSVIARKRFLHVIALYGRCNLPIEARAPML